MGWLRVHIVPPLVLGTRALSQIGSQFPEYVPYNSGAEFRSWLRFSFSEEWFDFPAYATQPSYFDAFNGIIPRPPRKVESLGVVLPSIQVCKMRWQLSKHWAKVVKKYPVNSVVKHVPAVHDIVLCAMEMITALWNTPDQLTQLTVSLKCDDILLRQFVFKPVTIPW